MAAKFEISKDKAGKFRFHLKTANGEIIAASQGYDTKASAENGIESVKRNARAAKVLDLPVQRVNVVGADHGGILAPEQTADGHRPARVPLAWDKPATLSPGKSLGNGHPPPRKPLPRNRGGIWRLPLSRLRRRPDFDDADGGGGLTRPVGSFNRSRWNTATTWEIPHGESPARGPTVPGLRLCLIFRTPPAHSV